MSPCGLDIRGLLSFTTSMYRRWHLAGTAAAGVGLLHTRLVRAVQGRESVAGGCTESEWLLEFPEVRNTRPSETRSTVVVVVVVVDQLPVCAFPAPPELTFSVLVYGRSVTRGL